MWVWTSFLTVELKKKNFFYKLLRKARHVPQGSNHTFVPDEEPYRTGKRPNANDAHTHVGAGIISGYWGTITGGARSVSLTYQVRQKL